MYDAPASKITPLLLEEPKYNECLKKTVRRYKLKKDDVKKCSSNIFDKLHAEYADWGNTMDVLTVYDSKYSITEVAAIESLFCALKKLGCFYFPLRIIAK